MPNNLSENEKALAKLATPTRNRYFYGKLLDEFHFAMEQSYFNYKRWLLNRLTWGSGVVCGLNVLAAEGQLQIGPGVAIDPLGREIIVPDGTQLTIDPRALTDVCGCPTGERVEGEGDVTICLAYHECEAEPVPVLVGDCEKKCSCAPSIVRERYKVLVREGKPEPIELVCGQPDLFTPPEGAQGVPNIHPWLVERISQACSTTKEEVCVVLAHVRLPDTGVTQECIDPTVRPVVYNTELLLELLLCLAERVDQCCRLHILRYISGDAQHALPNGILNEPLAVKIVDDQGNGVPDVPITFQVQGGDGSVGDGSSFAEEYISSSSSDGIVTAHWQLGPTAGLNTLEATIPSGSRIIFHALAEGDIPPDILLSKVSGDNQTGKPNAPLPEPIRVKAVNSVDGLPMEGKRVAFSVFSGGGSVEPLSVLTDENGEAEVTWTLGAEAGEQRLGALAESAPGQIFRAKAMSLHILSGNGQQAERGMPLPEPVRVQVVNGVDGPPATGEHVSFFVLSGGGSVEQLTPLTNENGEAEAAWTLGSELGTQSLIAHITSTLEDKSFQATALPATLKISSWQAPSTLNPYLSNGKKEMLAASLVLEPLACYDDEGELIPILAREIPTRENGGVLEEVSKTITEVEDKKVETEVEPEIKKTVITWKLRTDILWSDGTPLTADDVIFTYDYCRSLIDTDGTGCSAANRFADVEAVEKGKGDHTVRVIFSGFKAMPYGPFVSFESPILQKAQFEACMGADARGYAGNKTPVGTGPYKVMGFEPDVVRYAANECYREHELDKPYFGRVTLGHSNRPETVVSEIQAGGSDYGWNLQVMPPILDDLSQNENVKVMAAFGTAVECLMINLTNPDPLLGNQRSEWTPPNPHPLLSNPAVRRALSLAIDREAIAEICAGDYGNPTGNVLCHREYSPGGDDCPTQDIDEARKLLQGIAATGSVLLQTSANQVREEIRNMIVEWWDAIDVAVDSKDVDASTLFGGDPTQDDTTGKFYADVQLFTIDYTGTDPEIFMSSWKCDAIARRANEWLGRNVPRYCSENYDSLVAKMTESIDQDRVNLAEQMNDLIVQEYVVIPLVHRQNVSARAKSLHGVRFNPWDSEFWNIADWIRE